MTDPSADYKFRIETLKNGSTADWQELAFLVPGFPMGCDDVFGTPWFSFALQSGSLKAVEWMILQGVDLKAKDIGYTVLQTVLERDSDDRNVMLRVLLKAGADPNAHGIHDWTALHMAAFIENFEAMEILLQAGAKRDARTRIDNYATPEEEARILGRPKAADFLRDWTFHPIKPQPKARR